MVKPLITVCAISLVLPSPVNTIFTQPMDVLLPAISPAGADNWGGVMRKNIFRNPNIALSDAWDDPLVAPIETVAEDGDVVASELETVDDPSVETVAL